MANKRRDRDTKSVAELRAEALQLLDEQGHVNLPDAAVILGVHTQTVKEWILKGKIRFVYYGSRKHILSDEVYRVLARKTEGTLNEEGVTPLLNSSLLGNEPRHLDRSYTDPDGDIPYAGED